MHIIPIDDVGSLDFSRLLTVERDKRAPGSTYNLFFSLKGHIFSLKLKRIHNSCEFINLSIDNVGFHSISYEGTHSSLLVYRHLHNVAHALFACQ